MNELAVDGMDLYRFPRVIPDDFVIVDAFPSAPIPERLQPVLSDLMGQLALASAPITGRRTACVLAGANRGYGGHVVEHSASDHDDPFLMAFEEVPLEEDELYGIMVAGTGPIKEKHLMPSGSAYDAIAPRLHPGSPIVVISPNTLDRCRFIPEAMHRAAYRPKVTSAFMGRTIAESRVEAIRKTTLCLEDCEFIARLRHAGLADSIHYYLTGSANGQSGPSYALRPGMYSDLDIIAVCERSKPEVEAAFESLAEAWYGSLHKDPKVARVALSDTTLKGRRYFNDTGISIDFYAATTLAKTFVRPEYLGRNYFHQLS